MTSCPHAMCQGTCEIWPSLPDGSEFPRPGSEINWALILELADRPHPALNDAIPLPDDLWAVREALTQVKVAHHLLDIARVPRRYSLDTGDIASRTLIAALGMGTLRERLSRIADWHFREQGPAGTVGNDCAECGGAWPCDTRRMADGTYHDDDDNDDQEVT
jgi:hypothetical protein